jgi:uncharacterized protein YndB with AHSA1/START domain
VEPVIVTRRLHINAHRSVVWAALTEPHLISEWFSDTAELDLRVGGHGVLAWDDWGSYPILITQVDEPDAFAFRWPHAAGGDASGASTTLVRFTLLEARGGTDLTVVESGWEVFGDDAAAFSDENTEGWLIELDELQAFLEKQDSV